MLYFKFPFGPLETNAILLGCSKTKKAAVIDPSYGSMGAVLDQVQGYDLKLEKILFTHSHWDHFADAYSLKNKTDAPIYVHPLDAGNVESPGTDGIPLYIPIQPIKPDHFLNEGDVVEVGEIKP